jgi:hypothetical protein
MATSSAWRSRTNKPSGGDLSAAHQRACDLDTNHPPLASAANANTASMTTVAKISGM